MDLQTNSVLDTFPVTQNSSGCGLEVTVREAGQGKCAPFLCDRQSRHYRPSRSCFQRAIRGTHHFLSWTYGQLVSVCIHVSPLPWRPPSCLVTFSCSLAQPRCSLVPRNGKRLQIYLGKQSRKRRMQIYPHRPCLSNKSKKLTPQKHKSLAKGERNARRNRGGGREAQPAGWEALEGETNTQT